LFLIIIIGFIGIYQIQSSLNTIVRLGEGYLPLQRAVLEMRINNSLYAMEIRNYFFWKGSKYLDSARLAVDSEKIKKTKQDFSKTLKIFASLAKKPEQKEWAKRVKQSGEGLQSIGSRIIELVDQKADRKKINKLLMNFESLSYQIDEFLNNKVEIFNLETIKTEIVSARLQKRRSILFLSWSLVLSFLIGTATAAAAYHNQRQQQQKQQQLTQKMIKIEEENKADFSLQIHDQMGQELSALKIYLDLISQAAADNNQIKKNSEESKKILAGLIEKTHNISELIRPPALDELGLLDTISALVDQYRRISKIKINYKKPSPPIHIPREHSLTIYRLVQEGLTNIIKHAKATSVELALEVKGGIFKLVLKDNGKGFDYKNYLKNYRRRRQDKLKLGLSGLKERVTLLGGQMEIKTAPDKGTKLVVELLLDNA
jgi:signal transduction histidine kinase/preprotein translocase subunit Sss1